MRAKSAPISQTIAKLGGKQPLPRILISKGLFSSCGFLFAGVKNVFSLFVILIKSSLGKHKTRVTFLFNRKTLKTAHQIANC